MATRLWQSWTDAGDARRQNRPVFQERFLKKGIVESKGIRGVAVKAIKEGSLPVAVAERRYVLARRAANALGRLVEHGDARSRAAAATDVENLVREHGVQIQTGGGGDARKTVALLTAACLAAVASSATA